MDELWEEAGTPVLKWCLFSSKALFIETMVEVHFRVRGGLKVLANGINYSPKEWFGREEEQSI